MSVERAGEVLKTLKSSEHPYLHIIYWQCRRETDTNIATARLNPTVSANYVFQRKKELEVAFITHQVNYPSPEVCEALEKYFTGPPKFDVREGVTPTPIIIEQDSEDPPPPPSQPEQQPDPTPPRQGPQVIIPPARQTTKREGCLSLPVLLGALLLVVTGLLVWSVLTDESQPVDRIVEVTREIESIVEVTVPPIEVTRIVEVINTVEVPIKETVVVVQTVPAVEVTKLVEVTSAPTPTPTETPLPQTVVISEDFDDGEIDSAFEVIGDPVLVGGQLTVVEDTWLELRIGDETWGDYTVEYDVFKPCRGARHEVSVRRLNSAQELVYVYNCGGGGWQSKSVSGSFDIPASGVSTQSRIRIWLEGDRLYQENGDGTFVYTLPNHETGGVAIRFSNGWIDNLVITRND